MLNPKGVDKLLQSFRILGIVSIIGLDIHGFSISDQPAGCQDGSLETSFA